MRRVALRLCVILASAAAAGCAGRGGGPVRASLVRPAPPPPISAPELDNYGRLLVPRGAAIVVEGDDTAYAPALVGEPRTLPPINGSVFRRMLHPWPMVMAHRLKREVQVTEAVHPGDLASDGVSRWSTTPAGAVTFIAYGLAEAQASDPVAPADFKAAVQILSNRARAGGGWAVLVLPPPYPDKGLNADLAPYRAVMRALGAQPRTLVLDPAPVLAATGGAYTGKRRLSDAGQRAIGDAAAGLLLLAPRAG